MFMCGFVRSNFSVISLLEFRPALAGRLHLTTTVRVCFEVQDVAVCQSPSR
jgi:hypothetical protein